MNFLLNMYEVFMKKVGWKTSHSKWYDAQKYINIYRESYETYIFVYGNLKKGFPRHYLLKGAELKSRSVTTLNNYDLVAIEDRWPGLVKRNGNEHYKVTGELYKINGKILWKLDNATWDIGLYIRKFVSILDENKYNHTVFTYLVNTDRNDINYTTTPRDVTETHGVKTWNLPISATEHSWYYYNL